MPSVVLPSMTKRFGLMPELRRMWQYSELAVRDADTITVFGFSFPKSDFAVQRLLRAELSRCSKPRVIRVLDVAPEPIVLTLKDLLSNCKNIEYQPFEVPRDYSTPSWYTLSGVELALA
jgi:hypothetical protein